MGKTKTPQHAKKQQSTKELVTSGAGDWIVMPNGKFWDRRRARWVLRCHGCGKSFYAERCDAKTHSPACRKRVQRRTLKQNDRLAKELKTAHKDQLVALGF